LEIHISNENKFTFLEILIKPKKDNNFLVEGWAIDESDNRSERYIRYEIATKGKKQKGEICRHCGKIHKMDNRKFFYKTSQPK